MPKFVAERKFSLNFLGEKWKDCFILFSSVSIRESRELVKLKLGTKTPEEILDVTVGFMKRHFISGNAYDSLTKQIVSLKLEELEDMPTTVQEKAIIFLVGGASQ